jgi:basic amino acid/polyamine antiporter, APA family
VHPTRRTPWASIIFTTLISLGLIIYVTQTGDSDDVVSVLGGTTALLLLGVFTVVNVAVLVLRRDPVEGPHFVAPTIIPILGALACAFFVGPWTDRDDRQYEVALWLLALGVVLWVITWFANRAIRAKRTFLREPTDLGG